eukprot:2493754-Rhodomonas_salina.1
MQPEALMKLMKTRNGCRVRVVSAIRDAGMAFPSLFAVEILVECVRCGNGCVPDHEGDDVDVVFDDHHLLPDTPR